MPRIRKTAEAVNMESVDSNKVVSINKRLFDVKIRLENELLGTVSKEPAVYKAYIESKKPVTLVNEDESATIDNSDIDQLEQRGWTGFHIDENGLFILNYMVKGFLKNAGNILKGAAEVKNLRSKLNDFVFVYPRRIHLGRMIPDGVLERPIRVLTAQGPRVALIRSDFVEAGVELNFKLKLFPHPEITPELLNILMEYGEDQGLGQFRNGGYGAFSVISFKEIFNDTEEL